MMISVKQLAVPLDRRHIDLKKMGCRSALESHCYLLFAGILTLATLRRLMFLRIFSAIKEEQRQ